MQTTGGVHTPPWQVSPLAQTFPQPLQLFTSVCGSMQTPEQRSDPEGQVQTPETQVCCAPQAWLHVPQSLILVCVSTQVLLQSVWPDGQLNAQVPFEQT